MNKDRGRRGFEPEKSKNINRNTVFFHILQSSQISLNNEIEKIKTLY